LVRKLRRQRVLEAQVSRDEATDETSMAAPGEAADGSRQTAVSRRQ
jgi:hypothetical protein